MKQVHCSLIIYLNCKTRPTEFFEEGVEQADEISERESAVGHQPLDLVELSQVSGVQRLVPEHTVDGEVLGGLELSLQSDKNNLLAFIDHC